MQWPYETFRSAGRLVCIVFLAHFADLEPAILEFAAPGARKLRERGDAWSLYCGAARDPRCAKTMVWSHTWMYGNLGWRDLMHGDENVFSVVFKVANLGGLEQDGEIRDVHEKGAEQTFRVLIERLFPQFEGNNVNICGASVFHDEDGSACYYVCFAARAAKLYPRDLRLAGGWDGAGTGAAHWTTEETADFVAGLEETEVDFGTRSKNEGWDLVSKAVFSRPDGGQSRSGHACKRHFDRNRDKFMNVLPEGHWAFATQAECNKARAAAAETAPRIDTALRSAGATVSYAPTESTTLVVRGDVRNTNAMRDVSNKEWDAKERGVPIIGAGTVVAWLREGHHL